MFVIRERLYAHPVHQIYKIDIVNNLQRFDNTLIVRRLGRCQLLVTV